MPSQIQYQPITGPVWRESVAENLAWLPSVRQPARALEYRRLGDFQQPTFQALYKPEGLQWQASDRYAGRVLPRARLDWTVELPILASPAYDPSYLEWLPGGRAPRVLVQRRILGDFQQPPFVALYRPELLQWQSIDRYRGRSLPLSLQGGFVVDLTPVLPAVVVASAVTPYLRTFDVPRLDREVNVEPIDRVGDVPRRDRLQ